MTSTTTPPEVLKQWRAEFEAELTKGYTTLAFNNGKYHNHHVQSLWEGFLLGRQTACVELPKTMGADSCLLSYPEVRKAIIAQGYQVRVKGE